MDTAVSKKLVTFFSVVLFAVIAIGLFWLFSYKGSVGEVGSDLGYFWWIFSFAAGLSMIVLPCTLPLAFVIVPLSMGRGIVKGLGMALAFGLGIALTLSLYGVAAALLGKAAIGSLGSDAAEAIKNWVYFVAGIFALLFALSEIGLMKFRMPTYTGSAPAFIQKKQDYLKAFLLGLFLGNIGVGCPHPATPLILVEIASSGNVLYGWLLFLVHAIGRVLPLIFLALLGIMGVNGLSWLVARKDKVEKVTGWAMVFVAGFILTLGLFSHDWWVNSGIHTQLEKITQEESILNVVKENIGSDVVHSHGAEIGTGLFGLPLTLGNWFLVFLWVFPIWWWWFREKKRVKNIPEQNQVQEKSAEHKLLMSRERFFTALTIVLAVMFIYILPHNFLKHEALEHEDGMQMEVGEHMDDGHGHDENAGNIGTRQVTSSASDIAKLPLRTPATRIEKLPFTIVNGVKEFQLEAQEFRWEYEPGKWIHAWGYNGQVPGPEIRVNEGDKVRVHVKNSLPDGTSVHWHGVNVPWGSDGVPGLTQDPIPPGGSFVYEFTAGPSGTKFYHTHGKSHITASQQLDMGLSGPIVILPKKPAYTYDREYTLVLDEWDVRAGGVNPAVGHVHGTGDMGALPDYNTFTINGRVFPYVSPIKVKEGEKVLLRIINGGTSAFHPMHTHGHDFELVALDGNALSLAARQTRNTYTINPGETADFLFTANNPGTWLFHCHHVHHASAGMIMTIEYE